jgi:hypothetical protein
VIGMSPPEGRPSRLKIVTIIALAAVAVLVILGLIGSWEPTAIAYTVITLVAGFVYLCYLIWEIVTGRIGLIHRRPTARRQRRLARRAAGKGQAEAIIQQERLDAALSHGACPPQGAVPPGPGPLDQARRELLDAAERHGNLSPEARAAVEKVRRLSR